MTRPTDDASPFLDCPECGDPLFPATGRGLYSSDGEYAEHREGCRCPYCQWMWFESDEPVTCACGTLCRIEVDEDRAYVSEVDP